MLQRIIILLSMVLATQYVGYTQSLQPVHKVDVTIDPEDRIVRGKCQIQVSTQLRSIRLNLWANQFSSKTTDYAQYTTDNISNEFYFYKDEELGGYKYVRMIYNGKPFILADDAKTIFFDIPTEHVNEHTISIEFELKLPKKIEQFGVENYNVYLKNWYPTVSFHDGKSWLPVTNYPGSVLPESFGSHEVNIKLSSDFQIIPSKDQKLSFSNTSFKVNSQGKCPVFWIVPKSRLPKSYQDSVGSYHSVLCIPERKKRSFSQETEAFFQQAFQFYHTEFGEYPDHIITTECRKSDSVNAWLRDNLQHRWEHYYHLDSSNIILGQVLTNYYWNKFYKTFKKRRNKNSESDFVMREAKVIFDEVHNFDHNPTPGFFTENEIFTYYIKCCGKYVGSSLFGQLQAYMGQATFYKHLSDYLKLRVHQTISFEDLIQFLSDREQKEMDEFLNNHKTDAHLVDYGVESVTFGKDSTFFEISNSANSQPPFPLEVKSVLGKKTFWIDGFSGKRQVGIPNILGTSGKKVWTIDPYNALRNSRGDRRIVTVDYEKDPDTYKLSNQKYSKNKIETYPSGGYNFGDKFMAGVYFKSNFPDLYKGLFFRLMPMFSFSAKRIVGQGEIGYSWFPKRGPRKMTLSLFTKSYDKFYQKNLDYRERFLKIEPRFELDYINYKKNRSRGFQFMPVLLWEEEGQFNNEGAFTGTKYNSSQIIRGNFWYLKTSTLGDFSMELGFEQQNYKTPFSDQSLSYGKVNFELYKDFYLSKYYVVQARFFASAFAWNSQKNSSSFQSVFTRGSIALSHQAFNDYLYDEDYLVRENQNLSLGKQVSSYQGGGFKHAMGSQYNIGMSNRYATAMNLVADFPYHKIKFLKAFFDAGVYGNVDNKPTFLYSAGVAIYVRQSVKIYFPFVMSDAFSNTFTKRGWSWERVSFSFTLDEVFE